MSSKTIVIAILGFLIAGVLGMGACALFLGKALAGPAKSADAWLETIAAGELDKAYANTTDDFKQKATRAEFESFTTSLKLDQFKVARWRNTNIKDSKAIIGGEIERKDGSKFNCEVHLTLLGSEWVVLGVFLKAGASDEKLEVPPLADCEKLVRTSLAELQVAISTDNFDSFYNSISKFRKEHSTAKQLRDRFAQFIEKKAHVEPDDSTQLTFAQAAINEDKQLALAGSYLAPIGEITFELTLNREDSNWKLTSIGLNVN